MTKKKKARAKLNTTESLREEWEGGGGGGEVLQEITDNW